MGAKTYDAEDIAAATSDHLDSVDPESAFFIGPTSESDQVYAFAHKLNALYFLQNYFENQLDEDEKADITAEIDRIRHMETDANTRSLTDLISGNNGLDIYAEGYWDEFIPMSRPFWEEWAENSEEYYQLRRFWPDDEDGDDPDDFLDDDDGDADRGFLFDEPPDDMFHEEFVEAMLQIIPFA